MSSRTGRSSGRGSRRPGGGRGSNRDGRQTSASRRQRTRQWVLAGLAVLAVIGMVAPGLLFATGTNSATTTALPSTTEREASTTTAVQGVPCSTIAEGRPVPGDFTGCVGPDGVGEPATYLGCPDGTNVIATAGFVGRPGGVWRPAPVGATNDQIIATGCV